LHLKNTYQNTFFRLDCFIKSKNYKYLTYKVGASVSDAAIYQETLLEDSNILRLEENEEEMEELDVIDCVEGWEGEDDEVTKEEDWLFTLLWYVVSGMGAILRQTCIIWVILLSTLHIEENSVFV